MAQTGYTPIQLYYSTTASNTPVVANLSLGELAINLADQKAYMLNAAGTAVVTLVGTLGNQNANSVSITGGSVNGTTIGATTASTGAFTTISATGVITSTVATGTAPFTIASTTQVANLNAATAGTATNATNTAITDNTSSSATWYPTIVSATTGNLPQTTSSTKLSFVPSTGTLTATSYAGAWAGSTIGTTYGGTGLTSFTANGVVYASSTSALATSSALTFDGTNFSTTGYVTATSFRPSSSSVPTNGLYLPAANTLGFATNSAEIMRVFASGGVSIGNTTDPGATNLSVSGTTNTATGSVSATTGVATTIYTMPTLGVGLYIVQAALFNQAPATFTAVSIVTQGNGTSRATTIATGTLMSISVSGLNIQATQLSGATNPITWTVFRIA